MRRRDQRSPALLRPAPPCAAVAAFSPARRDSPPLHEQHSNDDHAVDDLPASLRAVYFSEKAGHFEHEVEIEGGAPTGVADIIASLRPDEVVGEGSQASDDVGGFADARGTFGEGGVAHVVAAILNSPVIADPFV